MLQDLLDLGKQRTAKEALIFYIAYFLTYILAFLLFGGIIGGITQSPDLVMLLTNLLAVIFCSWLSYQIISKKNLKGNILYIVLCISSGVGAYFTGTLLGLIPVAYLTTIPKVHLIDLLRD